VIAHLSRDWSSHGAVARGKAYRPVTRYIRSLQIAQGGAPLRILVPGAGTCRLAWELARSGHRVEANDASVAMLLAARAVIGRDTAARVRLATSRRTRGDAPNSLPSSLPLRVAPHAGCAGGLLPRPTSCLASAAVPEGARRATWTGRSSSSSECASATEAAARLTLVSGSWEDSYAGAHNGTFDAIVTSYFLDTLPDPPAAVRHIRRLLRPGGEWVNVGPLQWHDAPGKLRFSLDELLALLRVHGFELRVRRRLGLVPYLSTLAEASDSVSGRGLYRRVWSRLTAGLRPEATALRRASAEERHDIVFWAARAPRV
jgi:carnosine N-methyltransferase